jgi:hypothetical protein
MRRGGARQASGSREPAPHGLSPLLHSMKDT